MLSPSLKQAIDGLSLRDKLDVFETIRDSVMPLSEIGFPELSEQQHAELLRRAAKANAHPGTGRSWVEIKARLER
ncbi:MAG: hypothetical protein Q8M37_04180 [Nevskia sp.]|nr:hypothetical protein [Nevskia sp.]